MPGQSIKREIVESSHAGKTSLARAAAAKVAGRFISRICKTRHAAAGLQPANVHRVNNDTGTAGPINQLSKQVGNIAEVASRLHDRNWSTANVDLIHV